MTMPIEGIPDWERRLARQDAFWHNEVLDRPVVNMWLPRKDAPPAPDDKPWPTLRDRWLDVDWQVERTAARVAATDYLGDALPMAYPNLGPEVFSAFFGCPLEFSETTSWSTPILHDWADAGRVRFSRENVYFHTLSALTDALLAAGRGRFYVGHTDYHPGADALAAFRDPLALNIDTLEAREEVRALLRYVTDVYFAVFDEFSARFAAAGQAYCSWPGIVTRKRYYVPSNDFSIMISKETFDDLFLAGIAEECRHMEANIYHLDGPGALRHLDSLLAIPELNAVQWVYGAGNGRASDWLPVYRRCQAAGKGLQITLELDELDLFMRELRPTGLWLSIPRVPDRETADAVLRRLQTWR